jgi:hypothetical protein
LHVVRGVSGGRLGIWKLGCLVDAWGFLSQAGAWETVGSARALAPLSFFWRAFIRGYARHLELRVFCSISGKVRDVSKELYSEVRGTV